MTEATILIVDDDAKVRKLLRNVMEGEAFGVIEAADAQSALLQVRNSAVDLVTLDLHLGADDGFEVARELRRFSQVPIIIVTGKDDVIDRVVGLELGADDYITKPFHVREVLARVRSVLRRSRGAAASTTARLTDDKAADPGPTYRVDDLTIIPDRFELRDRNGHDINLTSNDFKLLGVFLDHPRRVLSRDQLMTFTNGADWTPLDRTVDNQVARLRKKIERDPSDPKLIKTVRGIGYTFVGDIEQL